MLSESQEINLLSQKLQSVHSNLRGNKAHLEAARQLQANAAKRRAMREALFNDLPDGPLFSTFQEYTAFLDLPSAEAAREYLKTAKMRAGDIARREAAKR